MSDIAIRSTKLNLFGPVPKIQVRRGKTVFGDQAEFRQNNGVRAEFRAE